MLLGHLHHLVAAYPPLWLAILRGLNHGEQGRVCSEVWVGVGRYRAGEGARLGHMGYMGAEDEGIWAGMVRGDGEGEETLKEEFPAPTKAKATPPKPRVTTTDDKKSCRWHVESDDSSDRAIPPNQETPPPQPPLWPWRPRQPADSPPPPPKEGGDGADDPLVGTKVHVPYPTGVEVDTVTGVHRRKSGVVWVEYQDNPQLYGVARGLLFPTPDGAQVHLHRVRKGKEKATHPPPSLQASLTRRLAPCVIPSVRPPTKPKTNPPTNPKAQKNPTPNPSRDPTQQFGDPKTGSQEV